MKKSIFTIIALLIYFGSMAQTMPSYKGKVYTYTKKGDITVTVNDAKKTVLVFKGFTSMPTVTQVFNEYKKVISAPVTPPVVVPPVVIPPADNKIWTVIKINSTQIDLGDISGKNIKFEAGTSKADFVAFKGSNYVVDGTYFGESDDLSLYVGSGSNVEIKNFKWKSHWYRPISINGLVMNGLNIHDCSFKNVKNSVISNDIKDSPVYYNGTEATVFKNWKIENCYFENTSTVFDGGSTLDLGRKKVVNAFRFFTFKNNNVKGGAGNVVKQVTGEDLDISFNVVDGNNMTDLSAQFPNGTHNRIIDIIGTGEIHDNLVKNHQGNAFAISPASIFGTLKESKIYNNIVFNSLKYGMIDVQTYPYQWDFINAIKGTSDEKYFAKGAVLVFNNTVGRMNTSKDWEGQIIDLYVVNSSLKMYNNLGFDLNRSQGEITDMINYNGTSSPPVNPGLNVGDGGKISNNTETYHDNKYFANWQDAVTDLTSFKSKISGVGATQ